MKTLTFLSLIFCTFGQSYSQDTIFMKSDGPDQPMIVGIIQDIDKQKTSITVEVASNTFELVALPNDSVELLVTTWPNHFELAEKRGIPCRLTAPRKVEKETNSPSVDIEKGPKIKTPVDPIIRAGQALKIAGRLVYSGIGVTFVGGGLIALGIYTSLTPIIVGGAVATTVGALTLLAAPAFIIKAGAFMLKISVRPS
jgi:hypothetical protein